MLKEVYRKKGLDLYVRFSSDYGPVIVADTDYKGEHIRMLMVDRTMESATYNEPERRNELVFGYTRDFNRMFLVNDRIRDCLLIGGAAFSYPKYYISHFPDRTLDVVEINPDMLDLARDFFYLDDLYADFHIKESGRLQIYLEDGNKYLRRCTKKYDAIINDAYIGYQLDKGLLSDQGIRLVKKRLQKEGVYVINMITALKGHRALPLIMEREALKRHFKQVAAFPCYHDRFPTESQNCILLASDLPLEEALPESSFRDY